MVLQRIEAALTRLEAAVAQSRSAPSAHVELQLADELEQAKADNARLREAVGLSLRQIDALISEHSPGIAEHSPARLP